MPSRIFKRKPPRPRQQRRRGQINTAWIYAGLVIMFVLYFIFQSIPVIAFLMGAAIFMTIVGLLVIEIKQGIQEVGWIRNVIEIAIAIGAVLILWYGLRFVMGTNFPLDVVPSCSMLPVLQRGDMILIHGVNQNSIRSPVVNVSSSRFNATFSNPNNASLQCIAYNVTPSGAVRTSQTVYPGYKIGLLRSNSNSTQTIVAQQSNSSLIRYSCGAVNVRLQNGSTIQEAGTTAVTIANTTIHWNKSDSVIVYQTIPQDLFYKYGDTYIVHRAYAIINASGKYYLLTKGDNNLGLDVQYYNYPPSLFQTEGKVVASVPLIGYVKLILSSSFVEPTGCNFTVQN